MFRRRVNSSLVAFSALSVSILFAISACSDDADPGADATISDVIAKQDASPLDHAVADLPQGHDVDPSDGAPGDTAADTIAADMGPPPTYAAPVAYWSMNAADISGTTLAAKKGSFPATLVATTTDSQGRVGEALKLDGKAAFVDFGDVMNGVFAGADKKFSLSFWVKPSASSTGKSMVLLGKSADSSCDPDENERMWIAALGPSGVVGFTYQKKLAGHAKLMMGKTVLTAASAWRHVVIVYDGSQDGAAADRVTIYVDGKNETIKPLSLGDFPFDMESAAAHLAFGIRTSSKGKACTDSGSGFFDGSVDEVAIWDVALAAKDAKELYDRGVAGRPVAF